MVQTHVSHFGLTLLGETKDNIIFEGTHAACRCMAFAHGMEISHYEGFTVSSDRAGAVYTPAYLKRYSRCYFKQGGMIQKTRDGYCLVMPINVWKSN